jgi:glycosyltransferase involved in cell wall biosynthesis
MKILFVSSYFGYKSGFNKAAGDILYSLLNSSHEISVLTHYRKIPLPEKTIKKFTIIKAPWQLEFPEINCVSSLRSLGKWAYRSLQDLSRKNYNKKVKEFSPDVIIINSYSDYLLPHIDYKKHITLFISHGDLESSRLSLNPKTNVENTVNLLENFDYLIFVSQNASNEWTSFEKLKQKESFYIPNCADEKRAKLIMTNSKDVVKTRLGFDPSKFNVVCVANLDVRKGQDILINNFSKIIAKIPNINLYLVGYNNSTYGNTLKTEVELKDLNKEIIFCGVKKNAMEYIYGADLFLLPSRAEALPLVILEAMILETPILASNVSGIPEMITDGNEGFLFPVNDLDEILLKLEILFKDTRKRDSFAKNAKMKYWQVFQRENQIKNFTSVLALIDKKVIEKQSLLN